VDSADESLLVRNSQQKSGECIALLQIDACEQIVLMLPRHAADLFQDFPTGLRQMKGIQTPVIWVGSALDESPFLEIVQYRHEPAWMNLQPRRQLLLAQSGVGAQHSQNPRICRCEFDNSQSFSKLRRGMRSKLGEQERRLVLSLLTLIHFL
jgi:hypothetical protein